MSEYTDTEFGSLHVLRQSYRPSPMLEEGVLQLFKTGVRPGFLLHSTKEAYVDSSMYALGRYRHEQEEVLQANEAYSRHRFTIAQVASRRLQYDMSTLGAETPRTGKIRLSFLPSETNIFNHLASKMDVFPDSYPRQEPPRHYLYADFPLQLLRDDEVYEQDYRAFQTKVTEQISKGLFSAAVHGIDGADVQRPLSRIRPDWRNPLTKSA